MSSKQQLTEAQATALGIAVVLVGAGMLTGLVSSGINLYAAAEHLGWAAPWRLPVALDLPIIAYVILDHLAVILGARSRWLHYAAWLIAGVSVWANGNLGIVGQSVAWRIIYAVMPALWLLGVEALRFFWRLLQAGPAEPRDRIPLGRWIAAPLETRRIQWRMWKLGERSWQRMAMIEDAGAYAQDLTNSAVSPVPSTLAARIHDRRLPAPVLDAISTAARYHSGSAAAEHAVRDWVASQMVLPDLAQAALEAARQEIAQTTSGDTSGDVAEPPSGDPSGNPSGEGSGDPAGDRSAKTSRTTRDLTPEQVIKRVQRLGRKATDDDVKAAIRALFADGSPVTKYRVMRDLPVGADRAERLLAEVQAVRPPLERVM